MGLDIFKQDNELDQGIAIEECKKKIEEILKKQETIDQELRVLERDFVLINKSDLTKFLTEDLNFIVNNNGRTDNYTFESGGRKYTIIIEFNDFKGHSYMDLLISNTKYQYNLGCEYKDLVLSKLNWEIEEYGIDKIKRNDRTVIQENKKYWNTELKIAEESYNNNYKAFLGIKNLNNDERFYIEVIDKYETEKKYKNLVEFIRSVLESVN